ELRSGGNPGHGAVQIDFHRRDRRGIKADAGRDPEGRLDIVPITGSVGVDAGVARPSARRTATLIKRFEIYAALVNGALDVPGDDGERVQAGGGWRDRSNDLVGQTKGRIKVSHGFAADVGPDEADAGIPFKTNGKGHGPRNHLASRWPADAHPYGAGRAGEGKIPGDGKSLLGLVSAAEAVSCGDKQLMRPIGYATFK